MGTRVKSLAFIFQGSPFPTLIRRIRNVSDVMMALGQQSKGKLVENHWVGLSGKLT